MALLKAVIAFRPNVMGLEGKTEPRQVVCTERMADHGCSYRSSVGVRRSDSALLHHVA
jgi:hypothetical protein